MYQFWQIHVTTKVSHNKRIFYGQADRKGLPTHPYSQLDRTIFDFLRLPLTGISGPLISHHSSRLARREKYHHPLQLLNHLATRGTSEELLSPFLALRWYNLLSSTQTNIGTLEMIWQWYHWQLVGRGLGSFTRELATDRTIHFPCRRRRAPWQHRPTTSTGCLMLLLLSTSPITFSDVSNPASRRFAFSRCWGT